MVEEDQKHHDDGTAKDLVAALADLEAEGAYLDGIVTTTAVDFTTMSAAPGWTIGQQIGHLVWSDRVSALACRDRTGFARQAEAFGADPERTVNAAAQREAVLPKDELVAEWRSGRRELVEALASARIGSKIPWFGPSMSASAMASVRIMETWAHGVDITDALGLEPSAGPRLWHIADLGVATRDFAFALHGMRSPSSPFRVELLSPTGETWAWGPVDGVHRITGTALDFCLLVTQRRHPSDVDTSATSGHAAEWLTIAQVFAGPPGAGRSARGSA